MCVRACVCVLVVLLYIYLDPVIHTVDPIIHTEVHSVQCLFVGIVAYLV
jgi:hypothetical protein